AQQRFRTAIQTEPIEDLSQWIRREIPEGEAFFEQLRRTQLHSGNPLFDDTIGRAARGLEPAIAAAPARFLADITEAELRALVQELGPLAERLSPNRLYNLHRSTHLPYPVLARRLQRILNSVEEAQHSTLLNGIDTLLEGRANA